MVDSPTSSDPPEKSESLAARAWSLLGVPRQAPQPPPSEEGADEVADEPAVASPPTPATTSSDTKLDPATPEDSYWDALDELKKDVVETLSGPAAADTITSSTPEPAVVVPSEPEPDQPAFGVGILDGVSSDATPSSFVNDERPDDTPALEPVASTTESAAETAEPATDTAEPDGPGEAAEISLVWGDAAEDSSSDHTPASSSPTQTDSNQTADPSSTASSEQETADTAGAEGEERTGRKRRRRRRRRGRGTQEQSASV